MVIDGGGSDESHQIPSRTDGKRKGEAGKLDTQREECSAGTDAGADTVESGGGLRDGEIMEARVISAGRVGKTRRRYVEEGGVEAALHNRPRLGKVPKLSEKQCAYVIATACTPAPVGHDHWTLRLLADRGVQLGYADSFSHETVRRLLKKHLETVAGSGRVYSGSGGGVCRAEGRCA
jgi:hypothetical protein